MNVDLLRSLLIDAIVPPPVEKPGPRSCCADFASVILCDGETDTWECPCCGYRWDAPCRPASER